MLSSFKIPVGEQRKHLEPMILSPRYINSPVVGMKTIKYNPPKIKPFQTLEYEKESKIHTNFVSQIIDYDKSIILQNEIENSNRKDIIKNKISGSYLYKKLSGRKKENIWEKSLLNKSQNKKDVTIKNRERVVLRNKKLIINKDMELPKISYIVDSSLRVSDNPQEIIKYKVEINKLINDNDSNIFLNNNEISPICQKLEENHSISKINSHRFNRNDSSSKFLSHRSQIPAKNLKQIHSNSNIFNSPLVLPPSSNMTFVKKTFNPKPENKRQELLNDLDKMRVSQYENSHEYLNDMHFKIKNNLNLIKKKKEVFSMLKESKPLKEYFMDGKLYVKNKAPMYQINEAINFPKIFDDKILIEKVYHENMENLKHYKK